MRDISVLPPTLTGPSPLRVLHITNMYPSAERPNWGVFIRSQVESLATCGIASEVIEIEGWRSRLDYARALLALPGRVERAKVDLVHVHYGLSAIAARRIADLPMVVSFCGNDLLGEPDAAGRISFGSRMMVHWGRYAARRAQVIIVKSDEMGRCLGPEFTDVEVIANGVDLDFFAPMPRAEARARLGWPDDAEILLFPANPREPRKNFPLAEEVARRLAAAGRHVRLEWVYGRPQRDVLLAMNAADVMLNPSYLEGSPNAVKEAMAVNLPIVSAEVGDCRERLAGCTPGAVVARDADAFTAATTAVLDGGARRSNGRERVAPLGIAAVAARVAGIYRRAIVKHRGVMAAA